MQKKSGQKRHHYVPACYLKAWLDPAAPKTSKNQPYVWIFDRGGVNPRRKSPSNLFQESDMYTLTLPDGNRDLSLERGLGTIEDQFSRVRISKFRYERSLSEDDWLWVCLFAAVAHTRVPETRDRFAGTLDKLHQTMIDMAGPDWHKLPPPDPSQIPQDPRTVYIPKAGDFDRPKETAITALLATAATTLLPALIGMRKIVLTTDDTLGFITSDAPSTWHDPTAYRRHPAERYFGLEHADITISVPISPQQCLVFIHGIGEPQYIPIDSKGLDDWNRRQAYHAPSTLVARSSQTRPRWFEQPPLPPDSWDAHHPDPRDRLRWTSPACPPELARLLDELEKSTPPIPE